MDVEFVTKEGAAIATVFEALAQLRIAVFREYPYLYDGTVDYEQEYLNTYSQAERSFLLAVYHKGNMVGATTCIPLRDETTEIREPFENAGLNVDRIFYFGESILLPAFRGQGLGHRFFDEREAHVRQFETYDQICFLAVERAADHPAKPSDYRSHEKFWQKRGYVRQPSLRATLEWPDTGESQASAKTLVGWMKKM